MNVLGIIPARSGSTRIKNKCIAKLGGYPLIYWTIKEALKTETLNRVIVSTDSQHYAEIAHNHGAEVPFLRPPEISGDCDTTLVLKHCVEFLDKKGYPVDAVVTLQPTSPFRKAEDIDACVGKLIETGADSVVSVKPVREFPQWMFRIEENKMVPFLQGIDAAKVSGMIAQELGGLFFPTGAVYVTRRNTLMRENRIFGSYCLPYIMPEERSLDIETPEDLKFAELMLEGGRRGA